MERDAPAGGKPAIRPYAASDAAEVRRIAVATADSGRDGAVLLPDPRLLADLLTRYTTDVEPGSCWVATIGGRVVGYVAGCLDHGRLARRMLFGPGPRIACAALARGLLFRRWLWRIAARNLALRWRARGRSRADLRAYPAGVHINLLPEARGGGLGRALLERFLAHAREAGATGVHANVREDNERARAFFERMGFRALDRFVAFSPAVAGEADRVTVVYGLRLRPADGTGDEG